MLVWNFCLENAERITRYGSIVVTCCGMLAFLLTLFFWKWVFTWYHESSAKLAVALFRAIAAGSAIFSRIRTPNADEAFIDQPWVVTTLIAIFGYLIWEFTGVIGDGKLKSSKEKKQTEFASEIEGLRQDLEDAELQAYRLGWLVTHLRTLATEKLYRIRQHIVQTTVDTRPSIARARLGLQPTASAHKLAVPALWRNRVQIVS